ncbi:YcnI family protein [Streptomyces sp. SP17BM10]|uniref:YcnI family copper-binding membrane protein n=1 Tax=Streptomyces sp. SP17BM10 TaxID=3002530 RepID=UPI002E770121|nr:YcnI family protein [Streptomyces sp. SP17BM10]MEE1788460.1 YcnI family protein [Streptomyces sp. SP17BM10]
MRASSAIRLAAASAVAATAVLAGATAASAHVTVQPSSVPKNATDQTFAFRVPDEDDKNSTVKVEIDFPVDHPVPSALVAPVPGWTDTITTTKLATPIHTDDGDITDVVQRIVWTGGQIAPGHYQDFTVDLGALPDGTDKVVFKALQTYGDGSIVRWIEEPQDGQPEPKNPAPVLRLTAATAAEAATPAAAPAAPAAPTAPTAPAAPVTPVAAKAATSDSTARAIGIAGVVLGALGVAAGLLLGRRRPGPSA